MTTEIHIVRPDENSENFPTLIVEFGGDRGSHAFGQRNYSPRRWVHPIGDCHLLSVECSRFGVSCGLARQYSVVLQADVPQAGSRIRGRSEKGSLNGTAASILIHACSAFRHLSSFARLSFGDYFGKTSASGVPIDPEGGLIPR